MTILEYGRKNDDLWMDCGVGHDVDWVYPFPSQQAISLQLRLGSLSSSCAIEELSDHCRRVQQTHIGTRIYDSSILRQTQIALDLLKSGIDPWRNIFYRIDFERDVCRLMDRVVPISIESNANVFGADSREEGIKPVS